MKSTTLRSFRPECENLEDRRLMTVSMALSPSDATILNVTGNNANDKVVILENHALANYGIQVRFNFQSNGTYTTNYYDSDTVSRINVNLGGGSDNFEYRLQSNFLNPKTIDLRLGAGTNDLASFYMSNYQIRDDFTLDARGEGGRDSVRVYLGTVTDLDEDVTVDIWGDMGAQEDVMGVYLYGDLVGDSDVLVEMLGGDHTDSMGVTTMADVDLDDDADLDVNMKGGLGNDTLWFLYKGINEGSIEIDAEGNAGSDRYQWKITELTGSDGDLDEDVDVETIQQLP